MKRKDMYYLLVCAMLCQPLYVFATENGTETSVQAEAQPGETADVGSLLEDLTAGADLFGAGTDMTDQDMPGTGTEEKEPVADGLGTDMEGQDTEAGDAEDLYADARTIEKDTGTTDGQEALAEGSGQDMEAPTSIRDIMGDPVGASLIVEAKRTEEEYAQAYEDAKNANWGYTNLGIANVDNNLNIRAIPGEDGRLVGKLPKDAACEVLDSDDEWAHIKSGEVEGYVSCEFLLTGLAAKHRAEELVSTIATVVTDILNVRAEANTDAEIITSIPNGEELEVVESEGDWIRVYLDDEEVFVAAEYVQVDAKLDTAITMTELLYGQGVSDVRVDLCQYAKEFLGNPYVWGGTSLTNGADCSGYVLSIFKKYGVTLPHSSRAQANYGTTIKLSEAQPGDLIFYGKGQTINHVAIYIGNGQVIHASSPKTGIRISNASYRTPLKVVRILQV